MIKKCNDRFSCRYGKKSVTLQQNYSFMKKYSQLIAQELGINERQIAATITLLDENATIPFIARYRKERTGGLNEMQLGSIAELYTKFQELVQRKETILRTIEEQGKLTDELRLQIEECWNTTDLEDIYLPYKPHKKTRADIAREKGLEPLAQAIMQQRGGNLHALCASMAHGIAEDEALQGARDIIAEIISQDTQARNAIRREFSYSATLSTRVVKDKMEEEGAQNYRDYFQVSEPLKRMTSHRLLAIRRAESEGYIRVDISPDHDKCLDKLDYIFLHGHGELTDQVGMAIDDSYKRLLKPAIETEYALLSKQKADTEAIRVFQDNLRQLLLDSPLGQKRILALDPGFRTGCKTVVLSAQGDLLEHAVVFIRMEESAKLLQRLLKRYQTEAIAIGNGTASRECEEFVRMVLSDMGSDIPVFVVSENGASIYSASKIARDEFPNEDITVRGAVSIGRRLMDPLSELVKIDSKSIGVGQYQHDVNQTELKAALTSTVESVVNYVGVDVNTAGACLLTYISGLGPTLAQNIVDYRTEHGPFKNRKELKSVQKLGAKTYEQCAGFLRITNGDNPLDNTALHPESYPIVMKMAKDAGCTIEDLLANADKRQKINPALYHSEDGGWNGTDILHELEKPTRDPREEAAVFSFDPNVHTINDLMVGMELPGIVTNIAQFGAFVDIGVHKDGLIHISEMANHRISSPAEVVSLHQKIKVRVIDTDLKRGRIQLSLKGIKS